MKYDAALFTTLAVSMASVRAAPAQEQPRAAFTPSAPFVTCVQKTFPKFPKEGNPTTEQLRACLPGAHPQATRELVDRDAKGDFDSGIQSRGLMDTVEVLGKLMGIDQKSKCLDDNGVPTKLHDEFVWVEDVTNAAASLCNDAMAIIDRTGLGDDGGIAYVSKGFSNAHDEQSNYLHNRRKLLLTMAVNYYPPASVAKEAIKDIAKGVRDLCSAGVSRLMDERDGCTSKVKWYISQKAKWDDHLAAVGGQVGMYFDGSNNHFGTISLEFSEDSN
ncbi:uncharacterized protein EI97DRAFT_460154 [Westerdykella ornata]|uniref:Uncharacterized protein n=1 Tax=Westerdykella ornata TaxID=318751 RepID=A0A6A6JED6_WESOR|nr:uncharacterized protein EI97DRAFT_460154 [Westerdykella ornata]KAF2274584.1 hypothetical protein EI97DRAFT_460154 [Westerdykella ornata]